ncbi:hypothetical protein [Komagataeibacter saccharivorans]|uniref:hypothetical protein n=1 Tax=Komagataeibacter saccharivorans TaxID=265959 RepID=UPI001404796D|nr:hypothetical protein [Komagataeibacter saccharivorans]MBL7238561.1 hypothetical protein [Novacetimonas hansenii]
MTLESRHKPSTVSPVAKSRPTPPDRLRPARGVVIGVLTGLVIWAAVIAAFFLIR